MRFYMYKPAHPGELLKRLLINEETGLSVTEVALRLNIDRTTLSRLFNGHGGISVEMARKLAELLGTSTNRWINLQRNYDIWVSEKKQPRLNIKPLNLLHVSAG